MAHNRAERRRKTALIKRKLEREIQQVLTDETHRIRVITRDYHYLRTVDGHSEYAVRQRRFKNEGKRGRNCWECGPYACDWCLGGFYRKHVQRAQALENDLLEYLNGDYDVLRNEGAVIPSALLGRLPRLMGRCETK